MAWASHDLRTLLASIRLLVEALADGVASDEQTVRQYLAQAKKQEGIASNDLPFIFERFYRGISLATAPAVALAWGWQLTGAPGGLMGIVIGQPYI